MEARELLKSGATVSAYKCSASSHFIGLLGKLAHEYFENNKDLDCEEIEEVEHIALYKDEIILYHDGGKVFHFSINIHI